MNLFKPTRFATLALVATLSLGVAACGGDSGGGGAKASDAKDNGAATADGGSIGQAGEGNGRAFGASEDIVIKALKAATDVDDVIWDGSQVQLVFNQGSVEHPSASSPCGSAEVMIADDETALLRYPDGEIDCSKRYED